jgi:hypothetical protein
LATQRIGGGSGRFGVVGIISSGECIDKKENVLGNPIANLTRHSKLDAAWKDVGFLVHP